MTQLIYVLTLVAYTENKSFHTPIPRLLQFAAG